MERKLNKRGPRPSDAYNPEMTLFLAKLREESATTEVIRGKSREYLPCKLIMQIYQTIFGKHALLKNSIYHRIRVLHKDRKYPIDLRYTDAKRGEDIIFINRLNDLLLNEIFSPKSTGRRKSEYEKFIDVEESLRISKEIDGWDDEE